MGKATNAKKRLKTPAVEIMEPTDEQRGKGGFRREGLPYRRIPVIETLYEECKLTSRQFNGLARYRDVAVAEDKSYIEDSIGKLLRNAMGGGQGQAPAAVRTALELGRLERELGGLRDIARAVAVDDKTLSAWAMEQAGALERYKGTCPCCKKRDTIMRVLLLEDGTADPAYFQCKGCDQPVLRSETADITARFEPTKAAFNNAWIELRMAGERLAAAIGA